jgi:uncharacterized membrane protein
LITTLPQSTWDRAFAWSGSVPGRWALLGAIRSQGFKVGVSAERNGQERIPPISTTRLEAFSDGVIAIAGTLLILEVHRPARGDGLGHWFGHNWAALAAYLIAFATIGIMWMNHHALFHVVRHVDRTVLCLNLGLLATVAFLPLPTAVAGEDPGNRAALIFFSASLGVGAAWFSLIWWYLSRRPALLEPGMHKGTTAALRRSILGPLCYGCATLLALASPTAAYALDAAIALYFVLPPRHLRRRHSRRMRGRWI